MAVEEIGLKITLQQKDQIIKHLKDISKYVRFIGHSLRNPKNDLGKQLKYNVMQLSLMNKEVKSLSTLKFFDKGEIQRTLSDLEKMREKVKEIKSLSKTRSVKGKMSTTEQKEVSNKPRRSFGGVGGIGGMPYFSSYLAYNAVGNFVSKERLFEQTLALAKNSSMEMHSPVSKFGKGQILDPEKFRQRMYSLISEYPLSIEDTYVSVQNALKSGLSIDKALSNTALSAQISAITGDSVDKITAYVSKLGNMFDGKKGFDVIASELYYASTKSGFKNVGDVADFMINASPFLKATGFTFEQITAMGMEQANRGIGGKRAGTRGGSLILDLVRSMSDGKLSDELIYKLAQENSRGFFPSYTDSDRIKKKDLKDFSLEDIHSLETKEKISVLYSALKGLNTDPDKKDLLASILQKIGITKVGTKFVMATLSNDKNQTQKNIEKAKLEIQVLKNHEKLIKDLKHTFKGMLSGIGTQATMLKQTFSTFLHGSLAKILSTPEAVAGVQWLREKFTLTKGKNGEVYSQFGSVFGIDAMKLTGGGLIGLLGISGLAITIKYLSFLFKSLLLPVKAISTVFKVFKMPFFKFLSPLSSILGFGSLGSRLLESKPRSEYTKADWGVDAIEKGFLARYLFRSLFKKNTLGLLIGKLFPKIFGRVALGLTGVGAVASLAWTAYDIAKFMGIEDPIELAKKTLQELLSSIKDPIEVATKTLQELTYSIKDFILYYTEKVAEFSLDYSDKLMRYLFGDKSIKKINSVAEKVFEYLSPVANFVEDFIKGRHEKFREHYLGKRPNLALYDPLPSVNLQSKRQESSLEIKLGRLTDKISTIPDYLRDSSALDKIELNIDGKGNVRNNANLSLKYFGG